MLLMERMDEFAKKYPQYANLMPVRESIYKLDRLQGLQYSVYMAEAEIAGYTNDQMTGYLTKLSQQGVNYGMETLGFGKNFYSVNSDVVKQFVDAPWCNGENFSTRIWNDTQKLAQYLNQDIAQGFARGDSYEKLVRDLRQRFGRVNRKDAYRLVFTEGTYVMAESSMQPFTEDFERYRLSPVMDGRTCPICRSLARQVFEIKDRQPGVNFPPIHPWCRCSWEIVVDDWDKWIDDYVAKHSGDKKQAEKIANRMTGDADGGIIKLENIFKRIAKNHTINDDIGISEKPTCNPKFMDGLEYQVNCQRCVQVYEFRRRGYDVIAKPKPKTNNRVVWGSECFTDLSGSPASYAFNQKAAQVKKEIENAPDGARYGIYVKWKGRKSGAHVFVAEKENGVVRYLDPQAGRNDVSEYFRIGSPGKFGYLRMDDKKITDNQDIIRETMEENND